MLTKLDMTLRAQTTFHFSGMLSRGAKLPSLENNFNPQSIIVPPRAIHLNSPISPSPQFICGWFHCVHFISETWKRYLKAEKLLNFQVRDLASPESSVGRESAFNAGDPGLISGSGRSTGEGIGSHSSILGLLLWLSWWRIHLQCGRPGFNPFGKIPWRREQLPTPVFWPGEFQGQRRLAGYSLWVTKNWIWLSDFHIWSWIEKIIKTF